MVYAALGVFNSVQQGILHFAFVTWTGLGILFQKFIQRLSVKYALYTLIKGYMSDEHSCQLQHVFSELPHKGVSSSRITGSFFFFFG